MGIIDAALTAFLMMVGLAGFFCVMIVVTDRLKFVQAAVLFGIVAFVMLFAAFYWGGLGQ